MTRSGHGFRTTSQRPLPRTAMQTKSMKKALYQKRAQPLAIRRYVNTIDLAQPFDSQIPYLKEAFDAAKELRDLIPYLNIR